MTELETGGAQGYLRIATEEAFITAEVLSAYKRLIAAGCDDPGFVSLWGFYSASPSARATWVIERLQDLAARRLADMDATGIDKAIIALTAPGTHVLAADEAKGLTADANDQLSAACRRHPDRFIGMTAIAPQDPAWSAQEIKRGHALGFKAVILNGHVNSEYTDDPKYWPIFEAAEALDTPIYLHPQDRPRASSARCSSADWTAPCSGSASIQDCICCASSSWVCSIDSPSSSSSSVTAERRSHTGLIDWTTCMPQACVPGAMTS
jgi:5-carboxyvanillate decarboxylase